MSFMSDIWSLYYHIYTTTMVPVLTELRLFFFSKEKEVQVLFYIFV